MSTALVWFRRDLRCQDNPALAMATHNHTAVIPLFIAAEDPRKTTGAAQCWWLHHALINLSEDLKDLGLTLCLKHGSPLEALQTLIQQHSIEAVYWNRCYEPDLIQRDTTIKKTLREQGLIIETFNASLLNEPWTVLNQQKKYFHVFTPYWKKAYQQICIPPEYTPQAGLHTPKVASDTLSDWQLLPRNPNWAAAFGDYWTPGAAGAQRKLAQFLDENLQDYAKMRDIPAANNGTSRLSPHLHFGEISPWQILRAIEMLSMRPQYATHSIERFLAELGWREFSTYLLYHFPTLPQDNFKSAFDQFSWEADEAGFLAWKKGLTGYPIVDAGMRELWHTGYMHNRVRMIVASFLIKDLQIDWRKGAAWFMQTLLDADLANNSASWQWVAGSGADASPWFRIFNPVLQGEKWDPDGNYVRKWVPELQAIDKKWIHQPWNAPEYIQADLAKIPYPSPLLDHAVAREIALRKYKKIR